MIDASKLPCLNGGVAQVGQSSEAPAPAVPVEYARAPAGPAVSTSIRQPVSQRTVQ